MRVTERENEMAVMRVQDITREVMTTIRTISVSVNVYREILNVFSPIAIFAISCSCYFKMTSRSAVSIRKKKKISTTGVLTCIPDYKP